MAKNRFALIMEDGAEVRNIDDLKAHFDIGSVVRDFSSGKLLTWLEDRYYDDEADAIKSISPDDYSLEYKLCKIFKVETPEEIERRIERLNCIERLNRLKTFTDDENILANVDKVAFDQEDLADLLDAGAEEIYLCANRFVIPLRMKNKVYIGVKDAVAIIRKKEPVDFGELGIKFKNVAFDDDYQKIIDALQATTKILTRIPALPEPKPKNNQVAFPPMVEATTTIKKIEIDKDGRDYTEKGGSVWLKHCSIFVQKASSFKSGIQIEAKGKIVDAKSILMVASLGLTDGTKVTIIAIGDDAKVAVAELKELIDSNFGEE